MKEKHLPVMPLFSSKRQPNNLAPDAAMHQTNLKAVLKMCRNAGVDYVFLDPAYNKTVFPSRTWNAI
ncbi:MAG: RsmD family RNA methyltransferase [Clostridia bacterium]|nr:RsmD family RNA methyltransferase [Clostridia bacterium]